MFASPFYHETKHNTDHPARITQSESPQGGRHFIGFPADCPAPATYDAAARAGDYEWRNIPGTDIWTPLEIGLGAHYGAHWAVLGVYSDLLRLQSDIARQRADAARAAECSRRIRS